MPRRRSKKLTPAQKKRLQAKYRAFSQPFTAEEIADFDGRLVAVNYGRGKCWLYPGKTVNGDSKDYARKWFRGQWTGAHRIALAIKLGCTLWDLEGYDAAHARKDICMGGRCCNPEHLSKKLSEPNRSWGRAKDAAEFGNSVPQRTREQKRHMMSTMYPAGMPNDGRMFDDPWQDNVSLELLRFLEMGMQNEYKNMQEIRVNTAQLG